MTVDVMPTEGIVLGFRNRWYGEAIAHAIEVQAEGERFRIVDAPHFCATKLDAYADRGAGELYHHDLEDVVALVDGRAELHAELAWRNSRLARDPAAVAEHARADSSAPASQWRDPPFRSP